MEERSDDEVEEKPLSIDRRAQSPLEAVRSLVVAGVVVAVRLGELVREAMFVGGKPW
jgi:hypothetical protein